MAHSSQLLLLLGYLNVNRTGKRKFTNQTDIRLEFNISFWRERIMNVWIEHMSYWIANDKHIRVLYEFICMPSQQLNIQWEEEKKKKCILHLNMQFKPKTNLNQHAIIKAPMDYSGEAFHSVLHWLQNKIIQLMDGFVSSGWNVNI